MSAALTPRETEVLELIVAGETSKAIGTTLGISYRTVELHRGRILSAYNVASTAKLISQLAEAKGRQAGQDALVAYTGALEFLADTLEVVDSCHKQFMSYVESHLAKQTIEGKEKAETNYAFAMMCSTILNSDALKTQLEALEALAKS